MRETWAMRLALATTALLLCIALALSAWRNREWAAADLGREPSPPRSVAADDSVARLTALRERGALVYRTQGCFACHSLAGEGNPSHPLDGVGALRSKAEIRQWLNADPAIAARVSTRVWQRKLRYARLPEEDREALLAFLEAER